MSSRALDRLVVPTDFSEGAQRALSVAIKYAKLLRAAIDLVHVYPVLPGAPVSPLRVGALVPPPPAGVPEELERRLADLAAPVGDGIECVTAILQGRPADEIVRYANSVAAELIVMGTHGRTGLRRALLGSVATEVTSKAHRPVLVVPPAADPA